MIEVGINKQVYNFKKGITAEEILKEIKYPQSGDVVAAKINNQIYDLNIEIIENCTLDFVTINDELGNRIYRRSLFLILSKAVYDLFPDSRLSIEHSLSNGIYCEINKETPLNQKDINKIEHRMREIVKADLPIVRKNLTLKEKIDIYKKQGFYDKVNLLKQVGNNDYTYPIYELDGYHDYYFYNMVTRTGYLDRFSLHYRIPGFILLYPQRGNPEIVPEFIEQPKLANIFHEYEKWGDIIGIGNVSELNNCILKGEYGDLVRISEALHEKKIANIADEITNNIDKKRIILIAGPSSSGKTTFAQRLAIQLRVNGLKPVAISTDNYFVNREETPLDEEGNYDFEAIEAIDLQLLNEDLIKLLHGEKVQIPVFNFEKGIREKRGNYLQIEKNQPIIIEGIHGLNDRLTAVIPQDNKFKIYVSALTQLNLDSHNRIPTTDTRLIRRIVRDNYFRGHSASVTIDWWPGVRRGEEKNIFPFQENADAMFNSALVYELSVLKKYAEPLLEKISRTETSYHQAQRLLEILQFFKPMPEEDIPNTSILKEFIGKGSFNS